MIVAKRESDKLSQKSTLLEKQSITQKTDNENLLKTIRDLHSNKEKLESLSHIQKKISPETGQKILNLNRG